MTARACLCSQETFWQIELDHKKRAELSSEEEASAVFTWARRRLFDRQSALVLYELCVERRVAVVTSVNGHEKKRWRPTPLSTVELQKEASRRLRIPSDRAMEIAERLYQQGYLSYPRTETDKFKEGFDLAALVGAQAGNPQWGGFARALQAGGFEWPRDGGHDDQAHPPIHPVKAGDGLGGDEVRLGWGLKPLLSVGSPHPSSFPRRACTSTWLVGSWLAARATHWDTRRRSSSTWRARSSPPRG